MLAEWSKCHICEFKPGLDDPLGLVLTSDSIGNDLPPSLDHRELCHRTRGSLEGPLYSDEGRLGNHTTKKP